MPATVRVLAVAALAASAFALPAPARADHVDAPEVVLPADGAQLVARQWDGRLRVRFPVEEMVGDVLSVVYNRTGQMDGEGRLVGPYISMFFESEGPPAEGGVDVGFYGGGQQQPGLRAIHASVPGTWYLQAVSETCHQPDHCPEDNPGPVSTYFNSPLPPPLPASPPDGAVFEYESLITFGIQQPPFVVEQGGGAWIGEPGITVSTSPAVNPDGTLVGNILTDIDAGNEYGAVFSDRGNGLWEGTTSTPARYPGTFYWQPDRIDNLCVEYAPNPPCTNVGPVRSFTVTEEPDGGDGNQPALLRGKAGARQRLRAKKLKLKLRCLEDCRVRLSGTLRIGKAKYKLPVRRRRLNAGGKLRTLRLPIPAGLRSKARSGLEADKKVRATVKARASFDGRPADSMRFTIALR